MITGSLSRRLFVGSVTGLLVGLFALPAQAAAGVLDPSWGGAGVVTTTVGVESFGEHALARGNQVLEFGVAFTDTDGDFGIAAHNADGSLDSTFGTGGTVTTNITLFDVATAAEFQGEKLVVAGYTTEDFVDYDFAVARYNSDGSLDPTFGGVGFVVTDFGGGSEDIADAVTVHGSEIIVAGATDRDGSEDFALARYNDDGSLDGSFGSGGLVVTDFDGGFDAANAVRMMANNIVAVGYANFNDDSNFALASYMDDGSLDPSFGTGGKVETDFSGSEDAAHAMDIQGNTIVAAGEASNGSDQDFAVAEYARDGSLDPRFGGDGKTTLDMGAEDIATGVGIQYDGRVATAGHTGDNFLSDSFAVARFTSDGVPDSSFGVGGFTVTPIGEDSAAQAVAFGPDNRIIATGYALVDGVYQFATARYQAN